WAARPGASPAELDRAAAELQGTSGVLARWNVAGPLSPVEAARLIERLPPAKPWRTIFGTGTESRLRPGPAVQDGNVWLASAHVRVAERADVQFLAAGRAALRVWVIGRLACRREESGPFRPDPDPVHVGLAE